VIAAGFDGGAPRRRADEARVGQTAVAAGQAGRVNPPDAGDSIFSSRSNGDPAAARTDELRINGVVSDGVAINSIRIEDEDEVDVPDFLK
jgi:cell division protein FtsZ